MEDDAGFAWPDGPAGRAMATDARAAVDDAGRGLIGTVVLVEGLSDKAAVERLARRVGRDLAGDAVVVLAMGGVTNATRFLERFGPPGYGLRMAGLYDGPEEHEVRRGLAKIGLGPAPNRDDLERLGFFACHPDLEGELIAAIGTDSVEQVVVAAGEGHSLRTFQGQPAQQGRPAEAQLRRFIGTRAGRKIRYGTLLVDALDLDHVPRSLAALLAHL